MKNKLLLGLVAVVVILSILLETSTCNKSIVSAGDKEYIKKLEHENDSLKNLNVILMDSVRRDSIIVEELILEANKTKEKVIYINKKTNESFKIIDGFNDNQLDSLFSTFNIEAP